MKSQLLYVELKSGHHHDGPAWIGRGYFSKTGRTVYFNNLALHRVGGQGVLGNHVDVSTGQEYWVSGVKRRGSDRHWAASGVIRLDSRVVAEYVQVTNHEALDPFRFTVADDFVDPDFEAHHARENEPLSRSDDPDDLSETMEDL